MTRADRSDSAGSASISRPRLRISTDKPSSHTRVSCRSRNLPLSNPLPRPERRPGAIFTGVIAARFLCNANHSSHLGWRAPRQDGTARSRIKGPWESLARPALSCQLVRRGVLNSWPSPRAALKVTDADGGAAYAAIRTADGSLKAWPPSRSLKRRYRWCLGEVEAIVWLCSVMKSKLK